MKIIIDYAGNRYETQATDEYTADSAAKILYAQFEQMKKIRLQLAGGGFLLLGSDAVQACAIQILPTSPLPKTNDGT